MPVTGVSIDVISKGGLDGRGGIRIPRAALPPGFHPAEGTRIIVHGQAKEICYISQYEGILRMDYQPFSDL